MTAVRDDFAHSSAPEPHRGRTREILRRHPEIRELIGPSQVTFWWTLAIVSLQGVIAWWAGRSPWWVVFLLAYTVGAFANHALFVLIHECTHRLVFKRRLPNFITSLIANLPLFFPGAASFHKYHLKHHAFQGIYELDADLPRQWEARLVGRSAIGKALWLLYTGNILDSSEALRMGLVDLVVPAKQLRARTMTLANVIATKSPVALMMIKEAARASLRAPLDDGIRHEQSLASVVFSSKDVEEGINAFLEKRQPRFTGE